MPFMGKKFRSMSNQLSNNNTRIAKNTIFLYLRMFITMFVGLYTSRVVLQTLGVDDYGIYNIVGGIVVLFSFISNALKNATQRFLSFEMGKKEQGNIQKVFNVSILCHIIICLFLILLAETIGLWFCKTQLNVPANRENVIVYVYQFSVITFLVQVMQVPFYSAIISFERMSFYAYLSILEAFLKLGIVYLLVISPVDKLILYSALITIVSIVILFANILFCYLSLGLRLFRFENDKQSFKSLMSFSGWSMVNGCASMFSQQGANYLMNIFSGVTANAAFGIANQVSAVIYNFVANFQSAFQPQIVKQYSAKDFSSLQQLIFRASLLSFYLLFLISLPFAIEADYILEMWLGIVPENTSIFCILLLCYFLIDAVQAPIWMLIYGTGMIKEYTIVTALLTIMNLPVCWMLFNFNYPLYSFFVLRIILNFCCCIYRMIYVSKKINFPSLQYLKKVCGRILFVTSITFVMVVVCLDAQLHPLVRIFFSFFIAGLVIMFFGFDPYDRSIIFKIIKSKLFFK